MTREEFELEQWSAIPGYEGIYEASTFGRIRRLTFINGSTQKQYAKPRISKPCKQKTGYLTVSLWKNGKRASCLVHRLILQTFKGHGGSNQSAHLNGKRDDNKISNLIWATCAENASHRWIHGTMLHGTQRSNAKLTDERVMEIKHLYAAGVTKTSLANRFGVSLTTLRDAISGKTWRHVQVQAALTKEATRDKV